MKKHVYFVHPNTEFRDIQTGEGVYCGLYDVTQDQIDFGHVAHFGEPIQIDQGKINRKERTPERIEEKRIDGIKKELEKIDSKRIRALSDFVLADTQNKINQAKTKLQEFENQAIALRNQL